MNTRGNCLQLLLLFPVVLMFDWDITEIKPKTSTWVQVPFNLHPGNFISILGIALEDADYCQIDLEARKDSATTLTSLHIKVMFKERQTNIGSYFRGMWLVRTEPMDLFLFGRGKPFDLAIGVGEKGFAVQLNGLPYFSYKYAFNVTTVRWVELKGDCEFFATFFA